MVFTDSLWKVFTSFLGTASLDQALHPADQIPLTIPNRVEDGHGSGPIFKPPGGLPEGDGSNFVCNYSAMHGFKDCSEPNNRGCWLTNDEGITWDINTDYEATDETAPTPVNKMPIGVTRTYHLTATSSAINADGLNFRDGKVFQLDGESTPTYPGPWIQACWGDTIEVQVTNMLPQNGTSVHWHGIRQWRTMHMDGVNGITQCAIAPQDKFTYRFKASQYGSSWYHAHYSIQYADGLVGPITIHGPHSSSYDVAPDIPILITDWGHNSAFNALVSKTKFLHPGILLNGQGNISAIYGDPIPNVDSSKAHPYVLNITTSKGQRHLLRIINTSFGSTFVFAVDGHTMTVVEADFVPIHPYTGNNITVGIGQRYEVILEPNDQSDPSTSYWIRTYIPDPEQCGLFTPTGPNYEQTGILWYSFGSSPGSIPPIPTSTPSGNFSSQSCVDEPYASMTPIVPYHVQLPPSNNPPDGETERILSDNITTIVNFTVGDLALSPLTAKAPFNPLRINFSEPSFLNLNESRLWRPSEVVIRQDFNRTVWIQMTITNFNGFGPHPIHLHGHDFAILNVTDGQPAKGEVLKLKLDNPPRRDVVLVPMNGLVVIAFKADNPGNWLMHCHIAKHAAEGLGLQILERRLDALNIWPNETASPAVKEAGRVCGEWKNWQENCSHWFGGCAENFQDDSGV
ncbi:Multicopper oxidase domain containing protein [Rhypophila sp. PSN 637]